MADKIILNLSDDIWILMLSFLPLIDVIAFLPLLYENDNIVEHYFHRNIWKRIPALYYYINQGNQKLVNIIFNTIVGDISSKQIIDEKNKFFKMMNKRDPGFNMIGDISSKQIKDEQNKFVKMMKNSYPGEMKEEYLKYILRNLIYIKNKEIQSKYFFQIPNKYKEMFFCESEERILCIDMELSESDEVCPYYIDKNYFIMELEEEKTELRKCLNFLKQLEDKHLRKRKNRKSIKKIL